MNGDGRNGKRRGIGYASYMTSDGGEDEPVIPYKPPVAETPANPVAEIVTASLSAQAPTGGNAKALFFSDETQAYAPEPLAPEAPTVQAPPASGKLIKYAGIGLVGYALYRLFR